MIDINEQNHTAVLISSLDKIYNDARLNGKLDSVNLYILNIIYKLLGDCCVTLNNKQRMQLMEKYRQIYFSSKNICSVVNIKKYELTSKPTFTQAEIEDCNQYPLFENIYYWQETDLTKSITQIAAAVPTPGFFSTKSFDSEINFASGVDTTYSGVGYICFGILDTTSDDVYKIYDILNNDVTGQFNSEFVDAINTTLFVSKTHYVPSVIKFKIKKS
jgi:hypothetical protein